MIIMIMIMIIINAYRQHGFLKLFLPILASLLVGIPCPHKVFTGRPTLIYPQENITYEFIITFFF